MLEKWTPAFAAAVLALMPAQLPVPPEPDFSGRWKLVSLAPPGADAPETMTVVQTIQRTNVYGKPMTPFFKDLLVTRDFAAGARTERHMIGGVGGTIAGVPSGGTSVGTNTRHRVVWDQRTLVIENGRYTGNEWDERREEWSFDSDGRLRLVITTRSSQSPAPSSVTHFYQRR